MSHYTVDAIRSGQWWVLDTREVPGARSQVRRLDQSDAIKEAIALMTSEPETAVTYTLIPNLQPETLTMISELAADRATLQHVSQTVSERTKQAAMALIEAGLSQRDTGTLLGLTHQRIAQITA